MTTNAKIMRFEGGLGLEYVLLFAVPIFACAGAVGLYRFGLRDGQRMASGKSVIKEREEEAAEVPDKVRRMQVLFDNLDAYDGTDKGQVKV